MSATGPSDIVNHAARQRVLYVCAAVVALFGMTDRMVLGHFSGRAISVRVVWAGITLGTAWLLPRVNTRTRSAAFMFLGAASSLCFALTARITGGANSPLFHFILAMPLVIAVVLQEHPKATAVAAFTTLVCGVGILAEAGSPLGYIVQWLLQAGGMSGLAYYASLTYLKMCNRQLALESSRRAAEDHANAFAQEVQARDEFISIASHELRTPLTSLELYVQTLRDSTDATASSLDGKGLKEKVVAIDRQAKRLNRLIEELLDVTRIRSHKVSLQLEDIDAVEAAQACVQRLVGDARRAGCALSLHAPRTVVGHWDMLRLEQIITNLICNAIKYGAGQPVEVSVSGLPNGCEVRVKDRGIGIAPEAQEQIFSRFVRAVPSHHYGGLGLGLWIVRELAQAMGGEVQVESQLGKGATFRVFLPYRSDGAAAMTA
jgi:signal transduction histidine kinase